MSDQIPVDPRELMERLDRALPPHTRTPGRGAGVKADSDPMVDAARRLAQGPDVSLSDAALDRIEARLRQRATELAPQRARPTRPAVHSTRRSLWPVLRLAAAACLVLILVLVPLSRASASSLPGDTLYPTKRALEDVRLALVSKNGEPELRVDFAGRRLDEFRLLLDKRHEVHPQSLTEAADQLDCALNLLAKGYGNRSEVERRISDLSHQQAALVQQALTHASYDEWKSLQITAQRNAALQQRLVAGGNLPGFVPDTTPTPVFTLAPAASETPAPIHTPTRTPTPTATPSATPTLTPTPTASPTGTLALTPDPQGGNQGQPAQNQGAGSATRTPPGHGPTPGMGGNPPGQGGPNPGVGNGGNPPGQGNSQPGGDNGGSPPGQNKGDKK